MLAPEITTHLQDALGRLLQQYKNKPNIVAIITVLANHVQKIEDALYPLDQYRQLAYAYGVQLDGLGEIIGQPRDGLSDAQYAVLLYGVIAENFSDSTIPALLNIIKTIFQATGVQIIDPNSSPGKAKQAQLAFGVGNPALPTNLFTLAIQLVENSIGAAIALSYITQFNTNGCFAMAGTQPWTQPGAPTFTPDAGNPWPYGYGDLNNPYVGGGYASLIYTNPNG